jgi:hypothetical protein
MNIILLENVMIYLLIYVKIRMQTYDILSCEDWLDDDVLNGSGLLVADLLAEAEKPII